MVTGPSQAVAAVGLWLLDPHPLVLNLSLSGMITGALLFTYSFLFLFYLADWMDNRIAFDVRTLPVMLASIVANAIVGLFNQIVGLIRCRDQQHWVKTEHRIGAESMSARKAVHAPKAA